MDRPRRLRALQRRCTDVRSHLFRVRRTLVLGVFCWPANHVGRTGVKCLPSNRLPLHGDVLHDSHAEIIARRGFMLWLYNEISHVQQDESYASPFLEKPAQNTLMRLRENVGLQVYVSTLPCQLSHFSKLSSGTK